jgi:hypothetical protein
MMTAETFEAMPFGGWGGERLPTARPEAAAVPPQPLVIEPPPWAGMEADPTLVLAPPATAGGDHLDALAAMKLADASADAWPDLAGPPEQYEPLVGPLPPPPDWRAEEAERDRVRAAEAQEKLEPSRERYSVRRAAKKPPRWP